MNDDRMDELLARGGARLQRARPRCRATRCGRESSAERGASLAARRRGHREASVWIWPTRHRRGCVLAAGIAIGRRLERGSDGARIDHRCTPLEVGSPNAAERRLLGADLRTASTRQLRHRRRHATRPARAKSSRPRHIVCRRARAGLHARRRQPVRQPRLPSRRASASRGKRSNDHGVPFVGAATEKSTAQIAAWSRELLSTTRCSRRRRSPRIQR